jgi:hypothetical protein
MWNSLQILARVILCAVACGPWSFADDGLASDKPSARQTLGHAHNDYLHKKPLFDAIEHGMISIEADVFPVDGDLLVAHTFLELSKERTLERLYLKPLSELIHRNGGSVYGDGKPVTLLVDIKTKGKEAYEILTRQLASYSEILSQTVGDVHTPRAITVIISGDRPVEEIKASQPRFAGIDGRLSDLDSQVSPTLMPLISDNWGNHFQYRGKGEMSDEEKRKLAEIVTKVHARGRRLRFWATPESPALWRVLRDAGVDLIGTDDLKMLKDFLAESP